MRTAGAVVGLGTSFLRGVVGVKNDCMPRALGTGALVGFFLGMFFRVAQKREVKFLGKERVQ